MKIYRSNVNIKNPLSNSMKIIPLTLRNNIRGYLIISLVQYCSGDMKIISLKLWNNSDAMKIISLKLLKLSFRCCETYIYNRLLRQLMCGHLMNILRIDCQIELYWCYYNALWKWERGSLTRSKLLPCGHLMDISTINKMKAVQLNIMKMFFENKEQGC